jgi:hypothetical protein
MPLPLLATTQHTLGLPTASRAGSRPRVGSFYASRSARSSAPPVARSGPSGIAGLVSAVCLPGTSDTIKPTIFPPDTRSSLPQTA